MTISSGQGGVPASYSSLKTWLFLINLGLIHVVGLFIAVGFLTYTDAGGFGGQDGG